MIEDIFVVMGKPNNSVRQCPLAMDKWNELVIGPRKIGLELIIDTNWLTVAIPIKYLTEDRALLDSTWHPNRRCFKVSKAQKLMGKLHVLQREPIGFSIYSPIYTLPSHTHLQRTKDY
jgi:hypothetical protein